MMHMQDGSAIPWHIMPALREFHGTSMLVGNAGSTYRLLRSHFPTETFPHLEGFDKVVGPAELGSELSLESTFTTENNDSVSTTGCSAPTRKLHDG